MDKHHHMKIFSRTKFNMYILNFSKSLKWFHQILHVFKDFLSIVTSCYSLFTTLINAIYLIFFKWFFSNFNAFFNNHELWCYIIHFSTLHVYNLISNKFSFLKHCGWFEWIKILDFKKWKNDMFWRI